MTINPGTQSNGGGLPHRPVRPKRIRGIRRDCLNRWVAELIDLNNPIGNLAELIQTCGGGCCSCQSAGVSSRTVVQRHKTT